VTAGLYNVKAHTAFDCCSTAHAVSNSTPNGTYIIYRIYIYIAFRFTLSGATKALRNNRGIALLYFWLEGGEVSTSRPDHNLSPGKTRYPSYRRLGGPQGRSGQVRKISPPPGFDPRTVQRVGSRYTNWVWGPLYIEAVRIVLCCVVMRCVVLCCAVLRYAVLCCGMLCSAVLCCAMLCSVVLWCAVQCCAVLCCAVLCCAVLCCAVLCCVVPCCAVMFCPVLCCAVLCCAVLYCVVLCCDVLCCVVLCCAVLCCAVLCRQTHCHVPTTASRLLLNADNQFIVSSELNARKQPPYSYEGSNRMILQCGTWALIIVLLQHCNWTVCGVTVWFSCGKGNYKFSQSSSQSQIQPVHFPITNSASPFPNHKFNHSIPQSQIKPVHFPITNSTRPFPNQKFSKSISHHKFGQSISQSQI
jgi:hypothetical protein